MAHSTCYYEPAGESAANLALMRRIDELHLRHPFYGSRKLADVLGYNRKRIGRCFCCVENFNNIDLLMTQGYDFVPAVEILKQWLRQYQQDRGHATPEA